MLENATRSDHRYLEAVFVLDDDQTIRDAICTALRDVGYEVRGFSCPEECRRSIPCDVPTCLVVDLVLPGVTGLRFCEQVQNLPNVACVIISGHGDVRSAVRAMKLGAIDFLEKPFSRESLLDAVQKALSCANYRYRESKEEEVIGARVDSLSPREREIYDLLGQGLATKEIARHLGISRRTVDVHRSNIARKLGLESPTQLAYTMFVVRRRSLRDQHTTAHHLS